MEIDFEMLVAKDALEMELAAKTDWRSGEVVAEFIKKANILLYG